MISYVTIQKNKYKSQCDKRISLLLCAYLYPSIYLQCSLKTL